MEDLLRRIAIWENELGWVRTDVPQEHSRDFEDPCKVTH